MAESTNEKIVRLETQMQNTASEVTEIKQGVSSLIVKVDALILAQTEIPNLKVQILTLEAQIKDLKGVNSLKNVLLWVGLVASAIINVVVIFRLFTGYN